MRTRRAATMAVTAVGLLWLAALPRVAWPHGSQTTTVLFDREVVGVLSSRCVSCHMTGGASFPLETYEQAWTRRLDIRKAVLRRTMPPWAAVPGYGHFTNDNGLTLREQQFLVAWVEGLGPRNAGSVFLNVADANAPRQEEVRATAHVGHWQLGQPSLERPVTGPGVASDASLVTAVVDLGLASPRSASAIEFKPRSPADVRAATFRVQGTGQWVGSWTPWHGFTKAPEGSAHRLPANAKVTVTLHVRQGADGGSSWGTLGIHWSKRAADRPTSTLVLDAKATASPDTMRGTQRLAVASNVWALIPDVPATVTSLAVSAKRPDGRTDVLLVAKDLSPLWPTPFILKTPTSLAAGTQLVFDVRGTAVGAQPVRLAVAR